MTSLSLEAAPTGKAQFNGTIENRPRNTINFICCLTSFILTLIVFIAFKPPVPQSGLDDSWRYAVDFASDHHLSFGRDIVFTFGPLVSLYSDFRVPSQDVLYLSFDFVVVAGIMAPLMSLAHPSRRPYILLLPVILANLLVKDAIFFVMPFAMLLAVSRHSLKAWHWRATICIVAVTLGMLPLIKGTMSIPVVTCVSLTAIVLLRRRSWWGLAVPVIVAGSLLASWVASGQKLVDLPLYFRSQSYIAAGYTDAMSLFGDDWVIYVYISIAVLMFCLIVTSGGRGRLTNGIAFSVLAFVAFKAGFVRQDGHVVIAATTLALIGYIVFLHDPRRSAFLALLLGVGGWAAMAGHYVPVDVGEDWFRLSNAVAASAQAVVGRITTPDQTFNSYQVAKNGISTTANLPASDGSADIYAYNLSILLSSNFIWSPRPVIQSYSAYTQELASMNARHLMGGDAPAAIYFSIEPIDNRYPNLDDGASWPTILSRYDFKEFSGQFAALVRSTHRHDVDVGEPFLKGSLPFDTDIPIPDGMHDVWATFGFHPTKSGRLLSLLFKRPILTMTVTYRDGKTRTNRMIAGMAAGGFLLSPTIDSARDFIALKSGEPDLLTAGEVRSFRLHQASSIPFWGTRVDVELASLALQPDHSADQELFGTLVPGPSFATLPTGGDCWIDAVGDHGTGEVAPIDVTAPTALVQGWALLSIQAKSPNRGVRIAVTDDDGNTWYSQASRTERPDVGAYFHLPTPAHVGYAAAVDLRTLNGAYQIHVVQESPDGPLACPSKTVDIVHG